MNQQMLQHTLPSRPYETTEDDVSGSLQARFFFFREIMIVL